MATQKGLQNPYQATLPQKRVVSDRILLTDPMEIPMINALGLDNEAKFSFVNVPGMKYEWLQDTYTPVSDAAASATLTNDSTTTVVTVTTGAKFQPGDVIQADAEYMWVASVSGNVLTLGTRPFGGSQATHVSTVTFYIRYSARVDGADANDSPFTEPTSDYNYSVILQKTIKVSRTSELLKRYGIASVVDREIDKTIDEKKLQLTRLPYFGVRAAGSSGVARSAGGLDAFITTNITTIAGTDPLTQKSIEDAVQQCFDGGGNPGLLVCGAWAKRKIADFYAGYVETTRDEKMGGIEINRIMTPLGINLSVLVDRWIPANKLYILDTQHVGFITVDPFFYENLGKIGDTAEDGYGEVVGEYGFVVRKQLAHALITGFSVTL